jgi:rhodanese-related sulfurtransferase
MKPVAKSMRALMTLVLLLGIYAGAEASNRARIQGLSASQCKQMLAQQGDSTDVVLMDIRTPGEYRSGHIRGSVLVDYYDRDFVDRLKTLDREKTYLVYCRSGNRSAKSLAIFRRLGFRQVYHLKTGIRGWDRERFPLVR